MNTTVNIVLVCLVLSPLVALAGSGVEHDNLETVQPVDWFVAHDKERNTVVTKCLNNPGELGLSPNCVNAQSAASQKTWSAKGGIKVAPLTFKKK